MNEIRSAAIIGAGTMGNGIAQACAMAGVPAALVDIEERFIRRGMDTVKTSLARFVKSGKLTQTQSDVALALITPTTAFDAAVRDVDIIIEARRSWP